MERGEVRWYTFHLPDKRRPVVILTRTPALTYLNSVIVAPITTTIRGVPSEMFLSQEDGMPADCVANFHNIQTVPQSKVGGLITVLSPERMAAGEKALAFALGLDAFLA